MANATAAATIDGQRSVTLRCHRCAQVLGEGSPVLELVGLIKQSDDDLRKLIAEPRFTWRCRCGWNNIFKPGLAHVAQS